MSPLFPSRWVSEQNFERAPENGGGKGNAPQSNPPGIPGPFCPWTQAHTVVTMHWLSLDSALGLLLQTAS